MNENQVWYSSSVPPLPDVLLPSNCDISFLLIHPPCYFCVSSPSLRAALAVFKYPPSCLLLALIISRSSSSCGEDVVTQSLQNFKESHRDHKAAPLLFSSDQVWLRLSSIQNPFPNDPGKKIKQLILGVLLWVADESRSHQPTQGGAHVFLWRPSQAKCILDKNIFKICNWFN